MAQHTKRRNYNIVHGVFSIENLRENSLCLLKKYNKHLFVILCVCIYYSIEQTVSFSPEFFNSQCEVFSLKSFGSDFYTLTNTDENKIPSANLLICKKESTEAQDFSVAHVPLSVIFLLTICYGVFQRNGLKQVVKQDMVT